MTIAIEVAGEVLKTAIGPVLTFIAGYIYRKVTEGSAHRHVFRFKDPKNIPIVISTTSTIAASSRADADSKSYIPLVASGPVFGLSSITSTLSKAYPKATLEVVFSKDLPATLLHHDLVLVGFPSTNEVTKDVIGLLRPPYSFDHHRIVSATDPSESFQASQIDGKVNVDYGYLIFAANPFNPSKRLVILAGSQTFGAKAAADYIALGDPTSLAVSTQSLAVRFRERIIGRWIVPFVVRLLPPLLVFMKKPQSKLLIISTLVREQSTFSQVVVRNIDF